MEYKDKFVGFVDVLGFSDYVKASADGEPPLSQLVACVSQFNRPEDLQNISMFGPTTCPQSLSIHPDLAFRITQMSDCVVVSAEVSPAGVINVVKHCWNAVMRLLEMGYLCRGYITRGLVWHEDRPPFVVGPGYVAAVEGEKRVSVLNGEEKSVRTPFVEVDRKVCRYVAEESDSCVRDMYSRLVVESGGAAALFPFKVLNSFTPKPGLPFEVAEKEANDDGRRLLNLLKAEVRQHVEESNKKAMEKVHFYLKAIDDQLEQCDERDRLIDRLSQPAVRLHY